MKSAFRFVLGLALIVGLAPAVQADPVHFTFVSGTDHITDIGDIPSKPYSEPYDILDVNGLIGSFDLEPGADPIQVQLNAFTFTVGYSSWGTPAYTGEAAWNLSLLGGAGVLLQHPFAGQIGNSYDTFYFLTGLPTGIETAYGRVVVTLNATSPMANAWGPMSGQVWADVQLEQPMLAQSVPAPEPASMLLLGTGLIGLARVARRRFRQ